jgi:hypothetical protein
MKWIVALVVLQLAVISLQSFWISGLENRVESISRQLDERPAAAPLPAEPAFAETGQAPSGFDENALRRIVRSELLAFRDSVAAAPENAENPEPSIDPAENAYRLDAVQEELSYHIERGEISELDMTNLQAEIARLDPDSRTMMMRELVSALNSGDLKGRL